MQVLLISGGVGLEDSAKVCNYSAGTDTNPIYLFNLLHLLTDELPNIAIDYRYSSTAGKCSSSVYIFWDYQPPRELKNFSWFVMIGGYQQMT
jgi:hypothetical protein